MELFTTLAFAPYVFIGKMYGAVMEICHDIHQAALSAGE